MDKHSCFIIMNLKVMKTGCHRNRCISTRVLSVEPGAARFSDGQEKPIEAVAKGEGRARVDIEKLNARTFDPKLLQGSRENGWNGKFGEENMANTMKSGNAIGLVTSVEVLWNFKTLSQELSRLIMLHVFQSQCQCTMVLR